MKLTKEEWWKFNIMAFDWIIGNKDTINIGNIVTFQDPKSTKKKTSDDGYYITAKVLKKEDDYAICILGGLNKGIWRIPYNRLINMNVNKGIIYNEDYINKVTDEYLKELKAEGIYDI